MPGIDLHTHLAPVLADRDLELPGIERDATGRLTVDGHRIGLEALYRPDRLEAWLDEVGLDRAVVSIPPPFYRQGLGGRSAAAWARAVNDGLAAAIDGRPRLWRLAYLPLDQPAVALEEYERIRRQDGWVGLTASAGGESVSLAATELRPLWDALDRDGRMLMLHPGSSPDARLDEFYLSNLLGNPVETALAAAQLVFGGVPARFPRMRVVLVHGGGCAPMLAGRWERGLATARPGVDQHMEPPREALRRLYVDGIAHDPGALDLAYTVFGEDHVVLGSDWPFPMGTEDPRALMAHRGAAAVDRAAGPNAAAALGLDHAALSGTGGRR